MRPGNQMSMINTHSVSLETLVRTALRNGELAPGVAKQIDLFRTSLASQEDKRLLAVLDDAIANGLIAVIELISSQPTLNQSSLMKTNPAPQRMVGQVLFRLSQR